MELPYHMEIMPDEEEGYVIAFPELLGCITYGKTIESAMCKIKPLHNIICSGKIQ